jgi:hypothetical protein
VWYHIICWHDSVNNVIGISINDGTPDTAAHSTGSFDSTTDFVLGCAADLVGFLNGSIDEVGFWKGRVLGSAERSELYNGGLGLAYPFATITPADLVGQASLKFFPSGILSSTIFTPTILDLADALSFDRGMFVGGSESTRR